MSLPANSALGRHLSSYLLCVSACARTPAVSNPFVKRYDRQHDRSGCHSEHPGPSIQWHGAKKGLHQRQIYEARLKHQQDAYADKDRRVAEKSLIKERGLQGPAVEQVKNLGEDDACYTEGLGFGEGYCVHGARHGRWPDDTIILPEEQSASACSHEEIGRASCRERV